MRWRRAKIGGVSAALGMAAAVALGASDSGGTAPDRPDGPVEEAKMAENPVIWWEINAKDGETLTGFYESVFGWNVRLDEKSGIWHLDSGEGGPGTISGGIFTGKGVLPPHRCLYVRVADVDEISSRAEAEGCEILQGPFDLEGVGRLAFFRDPEGHMIGLIGPATAENH